jgi:hypothetical protein
MRNIIAEATLISDSDTWKYRVGHKSLDKSAFKSQIFLLSDLRPTLYKQRLDLADVFRTHYWIIQNFMIN